MRTFFYNLIGRLPLRVRAFLPDKLTAPRLTSPAERTKVMLVGFARDLGTDLPAPRHGWLRRVFAAAHAWTKAEGSVVVAVVVVAAVAAVAVAAATIVKVAVVAAAAAAAVMMLVAIGVTAAVATEKKEEWKWNMVFFYTLLGELFVIVLSPLFFPRVSFLISGTPFFFAIGIWLFQGIRGVRTKQSLLVDTSRLPTSQAGVEILIRNYFERLIGKYQPEVTGKESLIDRDIGELEARRTQVKELLAYWGRELWAEHGSEISEPIYPQSEIDRLTPILDKAEAEIAWLQKSKREMSDALSTLEAHLKPVKDAMVRYFQSQRGDELIGEVSELTERARSHVLELQRRVREDVVRLLRAIEKLTERMLPDEHQELEQFLSGAEHAGALSAKIDSAVRRIETADAAL